MTIERAERDPQTILGVREVVPMTRFQEFFGRAFGVAAADLGRQGAAPAGPPVALYRGPVTTTVDVTAGFPVGQPVTPGPGVVTATLPGGPTVEAVHTGSYDSLPTTYAEVTAFIAEQGLTPEGEMWEEYLVGPDTEPDPSRWQTRVVFPAR
ncbi:MAG TPA: GyrI-like domain-containing protein [Cellulomonas sp.]|uniref:GyrI-like domain-containing protein n=1 Tax=Cellulomonas sp. TaxID=40001 RepID=UPI002E3382AC|nr:GyrI-like domain-containing protein [Cellulomonas sp.]HEX5332679.1 GyrI-like domain-containing protein [Cellulomonas sp.]